MLRPWVHPAELGERLHEVQALTGITKIESPGEFSGRWDPATEVQGEGIFIRINDDTIEEGRPIPLGRPNVHDEVFLCLIIFEMETIPHLRSVSHALIRQLSECGFGPSQHSGAELLMESRLGTWSIGQNTSVHHRAR